MFFGNLFVYFQFQGKTHIDEATRTLVFSVLIAVGILGLVFLIALRPLQDTLVVNGTDNDDSELNTSKSAVAVFKSSVELFMTREMLLLILTFFYTGKSEINKNLIFCNKFFVNGANFFVIFNSDTFF